MSAGHGFDSQSFEVSLGASPSVSLEEQRWYALHTRARHQKAIERRLRDQGMETYVPTTMEVHRWSDRKKKVEVPLFSCYVFVHCVLNSQDRMRVYQIDSVHGFVGTHGSSLPIPDEQIESIPESPDANRAVAFVSFSQGGAASPRTRWGDGRSRGRIFSENGDHSLIISIDAIQRSMAVRIDGYDIEPV